jgi:hypothetical protein
MSVALGTRPAPNPTEEHFCEVRSVSIGNQVGRLALLTVLVYAVIQVIPHRIFNHAISFIASAVWGS